MVGLRRFGLSCVAAALGGGLLLAGAPVADARDSGLQAFFAEQFGIGQAQPAYQQPPVWEDPDGYERPLVVRPHKRRSTPRVAAAPVVVGPTPKISIYEDKTLRRGDAVMTASGIKIFKGGASLPYRDGDFMAISDASGLSKDVTKQLVAINRLPRS